MVVSGVRKYEVAPLINSKSDAVCAHVSRNVNHAFMSPANIYFGEYMYIFDCNA